MEDSKLLRLLRKDPSAGMEQLINQYIYFCVFTQHEHRIGRVIGKACCIVQAESEDEAREKAYEKCGGECSALQFVQRFEPCDGFVFTFYKSMM